MNRQTVNIAIGGTGVRFSTTDHAFASMLRQRYENFVDDRLPHHYEFEVQTVHSGAVTREEDVSVRWHGSKWELQRADFYATFCPAVRGGQMRQANNPHSTDTMLRIVHSLILASHGGFLLHASSAVRNDKAFLFPGVSGAGKTTIAKLAPTDSLVLTDEISYIRRINCGYWAFGTPFAGEYAKNGENISAPIESVFLLAKGPRNELREVSKCEAARRLMRNVLFFAKEPEPVEGVFETVLDFVRQSAVMELTFAPTPRVWDLIV